MCVVGAAFLVAVRGLLLGLVAMVRRALLGLTVAAVVARVRRVGAAGFMVFLSVLLVVTPVSAAVSEQYLDKAAQNDLLFYDPEGSDNCETTPMGNTASSATPMGGVVTVIGDSISTDMYAGGEIAAKLPGVENISWFGRGFTNAGNDGAPDGQRTGQQVIEQSELRNYVVLALGTNGMAADALQPAVDAVWAKNPTAKIVLMTVYSTNTHNEASITAFNDGVRRVAAGNNDRVAVMDWYGAAVNLPPEAWENPERKLHPIDGSVDGSDGQTQFAEVMYRALARIWSGGGMGSGNTDIMAAKNADKTVFNLDRDTGKNDPMSGWWSDGNEDSMRRLLDVYGELAVAAGNYYGIPYIAILVQLRYEDWFAACGRNNFWGIACPPETPTGGGKNFNNLGEAFLYYGSDQMLNNGMHPQAIGIQDPIRFLEALGPTWKDGAQRPADGVKPGVPGYGYGQLNDGWRGKTGGVHIDDMAASTTALIAFINKEGWNGGYSGFSGGSSGGSGAYTPNCDVAVSDGLVPGGMNLVQAQAFMEVYKELALKYENSTDRDVVTIEDFGEPMRLFFTSICPGGRLANCSSFVEYFVQRYTTGEPAFPDGKDMVRGLINNNSGFEDGGTMPKEYAVFSIGGATADSFGHTGVVLGIDEGRNKIIIGEAGCMAGSTRQSAIDFIGAREYDLDRYTGGSYTYAYTDKIMKAPAAGSGGAIDLPGLEFTSSEQYAAMPYGPYRGKNFPAYVQWGNYGIVGNDCPDKSTCWGMRRWGNVNANGVPTGSVFQGSGCGPTSISMIVAFLTGTSFTPDNIIDVTIELAKEGTMTHSGDEYGGRGLENRDKLLEYMAPTYNLEWKSVEGNKASIMSALNDGYILFAGGHWGLKNDASVGYIGGEHDSGHISVIRATDGVDNVYVSDPGNGAAYRLRNQPVSLNRLVPKLGLIYGVRRAS